MARNKISISIAGNEFVVMTEESREYTLGLASKLDEKIRTLLQSSGKLSLSTAAILCALDLCDENEKNKASCARLREEIRRYLYQLEHAGTSPAAAQELQGQVDLLKEQNELLRAQLKQYELGQVGFGQ